MSDFIRATTTGPVEVSIDLKAVPAREVFRHCSPFDKLQLLGQLRNIPDQSLSDIRDFVGGEVFNTYIADIEALLVRLKSA